ncbi:PRC-barrel domain-containing protein [Agrobacterium vitis]|uniref:PRC-barrel domain-containing protein n=1 Tax=Agrobacterium vitis TaxID=373 RepID=A0AAE2RGR7_AGRVI|nr:PRC-barrel domain-containing protein [Agrobacterium vitis]MBF2716505.1 PRC-barrel domain-containing protein [Agrobacterium vitis]MUZ64151.1 PRC-barrel domain containing protein [Agrobacterium vitis]MVA21339.1 PRC-barrel domain containing protein [Agrobacterium vitis]
MTFMKSAAAGALLLALCGTPALAACNISDARLEEAILEKPEFRDPQNRYLVHDLRKLRDAAFLLWNYGLEKDCERLLGNIRELIASPFMARLGTNDEDATDQQLAAGEPQWHRLGQVKGSRGTANEGALISINDLDPGLLVNEIVGAEVRTADDKIVGEVRNVVIGTRDRQDYAIVAAGGFFVPGKDSLVVPLRYLLVDRERKSFFLRISNAQVKAVPLMPDQDYQWLTDETWRKTNDAIFESLIAGPGPDQPTKTSRDSATK